MLSIAEGQKKGFMKAEAGFHASVLTGFRNHRPSKEPEELDGQVCSVSYVHACCFRMHVCSISDGDAMLLRAWALLSPVFVCPVQ